MFHQQNLTITKDGYVLCSHNSSGDYTMKAIADEFGVHYATVSRSEIGVRALLALRHVDVLWWEHEKITQRTQRAQRPQSDCF